MVANQISAKQKVIRQALTMLGDNLVDIDVSPEDTNTALELALDRYRQRSSDSTQEAVFFLTLQPERQTYTLPKEIIEVQSIKRRGLSANEGQTTGNQYDPFQLAYTNLYLLQPTGQGDLLTFEYYNQWLNTAGRMFGAVYDFRWDARQHKITIIRHQEVNEDVLLIAYMDVSDDALIEGRYSRPWIRSYTIAQLKMIIGQAYEKFSSIPGPNGTITLNGAQLKAEAEKEIADLENQISTYQVGNRPLPFLIG